MSVTIGWHFTWAVFFILVVIRMDGDPFGDRFEDVPAEALPKSLLKERPADWVSGAQIFLVVTGYFAALVTVMVFLIVRAFVPH